MARHTSTQYVADATETFDYADATADKFKKQDVQKLGKAVENSTHGVGRGKAVERLASGAAASLPVAGTPGEVFIETDTKHFQHDDGTAWHEHVDLDTAQTVTGVKTFGSLKVSGPAAVAGMRFVGIVSADGAPSAGTWLQYDMGATESGQLWLCTVGGTPGTWLQMGGFRTGDVKQSFRSAADTGWVFAYGQTVDATTAPYTGLWTWANGESLVGTGKLFTGTQGALVFPDLRGEVLAGLDNMGGTPRGLITALSAQGKTAGEAAHTLTTAELPHLAYAAALANGVVNVTDPGHAHSFRDSSGGGGVGGNTNSNANNDGQTGASTTGITAALASTTVTVSDSNGGGSHSIVQPTCGVNVAIKL